MSTGLLLLQGRWWLLARMLRLVMKLVVCGLRAWC